MTTKGLGRKISRLKRLMRILKLLKLKPVDVPAAAFRFLGGANAKTLSLEQTLARAEKNRMSIIRWGDGETEIAIGCGIHFQEADPPLVDFMNLIIEQSNPRIIIGLPRVVLSGRIRLALLRKGWVKTRALWAARLKKYDVYADAFMFRDSPDEAIAMLRNCASRHFTTIVVSSNRNDVNYFCDVGSEVQWVTVPSVNAFSTFAETCSSIRSAAGQKKALVLIAAGPAAKAIIYTLSDELMCWDIGFMFELKRSSTKSERFKI